jgi:hypothetical protein
MSDRAALTLGAAMYVQASDMDGHRLGEVDLARSADGRAMVNGELVLAMRPIGSRVALIVGGRQYCVSTADYWQVMGATGSTTAGSESD